MRLHFYVCIIIRILIAINFKYEKNERKKKQKTNDFYVFNFKKTSNDKRIILYKTKSNVFPINQ